MYCVFVFNGNRGRRVKKMLKTTKEGIKGNFCFKYAENEEIFDFFNNKLKKINYELEMIG